MEVSKITDIHSFHDVVENMSAWQPIDIDSRTRNVYNAVLNGVNNSNYKTLKDAYDDSPTNQSIINSFVNFMYADGIKNVGSDLNVSLYLDEDSVELICLDTKLFGGFALQPIWNDSEKDRKILKFEYIPIECLAVELDNSKVNPKVIGYWYSYDWTLPAIHQPVQCKKFDGTYQGGVEIIVIQRVSKNRFFPLPDYFSCINYCIAEGFLGNNTKTHFQFENKITTVINFNGGKQGSASEQVKKEKAEEVKRNYTGGSPKHHVVVSYNNDALDATTIDQVETPQLNQQNVFFAEESERKIIVGHSAPKILFAGSNNASGFSSNADEILVATKEMYRRNINPLRKVVLDGLNKLFKLIDPAVKLEFVDFEEFRRVEEISEEGAPAAKAPDEETLKAQAQLKGSVGGVTSLLEIQSSYAQGLTDYESAVSMLDIIFGYDRATAIRLLGEPKIADPVQMSAQGFLSKLSKFFKDGN